MSHEHEEKEECCCGKEKHEHEECCCHEHHEHEEHHHEHEGCHCHDHEGHHHHDDDDDDDGCGCGCGCGHEHGEEDHSKKGLLILGSRILASLILAFLGHFLLTEELITVWGNLAVMLVAYLIVAYDVLWNAFKSLFIQHKPFNEATLMAVASLGAFALRLFGPEYNEFLEGVLVILLYQVGEVFEDLAADKSKDAITAAIDLRKEDALVETEEGTIRKPAEALKVGDIVVIGNGMKALCDGEVIDGEGEFDESSLTGEAVPVHKEVGSHVSSGTLLRSGSVKVRVLVEYENSTVGKLLDLVENSASKKSEVTRFITRFSKYYTPIVVVLALLVAIVPPLFVGGWQDWIRAALSFLVISCPCAIVISVPLAYFSGLGLASKHGVVVKGAGYFDKLNEVKLVAFDKTGTLTKGVFEIKEIEVENIDEATFKEYLCAAECRSSHPIGKAIVSSFGIDASKEVESYQEIAGFGVEVTYKGHKIRAGKASAIEGAKIKEGTIGSVTAVSVDGQYVGYVVLSDAIRENSARMIAKLHALGVKTMLLSGDKKETVAAVGQTLGLDEIHGELLPQEKTALLQQKIEAKNGMVAYVGDGINDAPSIVLADVGFAMGGLGSDAAIENADCVIMNDDPEKVVDSLTIAKKTKNRALFNIVFSLIVKFGVMVLAVLAAVVPFALPLWVSILADTGLALLMILSSLLLGLSKK